MSVHEAAETLRREMLERAETCWMSVEDAEITVPARAVALLGRDLAAAAERADTLEAERDSSDAELLDTHNRAEAAEAERDRLAEALHLYAKEIPCPDCDGTKIVFTDSGVKDCPWCGATGFISSDEAWDGGRRARAALAPLSRR